MMTQANRFTSRASYRRMIGCFHSIRTLEMPLIQALLHLPHLEYTDCHCIKIATPIDTARVSGLDVMHTLNLLTMGVAENTEMGCLNT